MNRGEKDNNRPFCHGKVQGGGGNAERFAEENLMSVQQRMRISWTSELAYG